jgi:hypothetical protein
MLLVTIGLSFGLAMLLWCLVLATLSADSETVARTSRHRAQEVFGQFPMTPINERILIAGTTKSTILPM